MLLNPPVAFFTSDYLSELGKDIPALLKSLWVDHIESDDEGFIPQALKVRHLRSCTGMLLTRSSDQGKNTSTDSKQIETESSGL